MMAWAQEPRLYWGSTTSKRRKMFGEAAQIAYGERKLIDAHYLWVYVLAVAVGTGLFMGAVGWGLRSLVG